MQRRISIPIVILYLIAGLNVSAKDLKLNKEEKSWLKSVSLIMTPDERKMFRKGCTTHEERNAFIELFWAKRDPDLSDSVNEFKQEYEARMDYIAAHFREVKGRPPRGDRGYVYMLLGPPTKIQYRTDERLVGLRFTNPFPEYPPQLWIYENVPYDIQGDSILIQMVPKNRFGDYDALVTPHVEYLLRTLKYEFIVHPDLEVAPLQAEASQDLQAATVDAPEPQAQSVPVPIPSNDQTTESTLPPFDTTLSNDIGLTGTAVMVAQGTSAWTVLFRIGFPIGGLRTLGEEQADRHFSLHYALTDSAGEVRAQAITQHSLSMPESHALGNKAVTYGYSFSHLLNHGRYTLQVQFRDLDGNRAAYWETHIQLPSIPPDLPSIPGLFFVTPTNESQTPNLKLGGRAFAPRLDQPLQEGEPLHVFFQVLHQPQPLSADQIHLIARDEAGNMIKSWSLFPEELTDPVGQTQTGFSRLDTHAIPPGKYTLQCEAALKSGNIVIVERSFQIR